MNSVDLRIERVVYGGFGLARSPAAGSESHGSTAFVPFTLAGELVEARPHAGKNELKLVDVLEASPQRVEPGCPHFGACGGCHLQMASYVEQLRIKKEVLHESLARAGVSGFPEAMVHAAEPWHYRNRIRLHVAREGERLRLGYRERERNAILPIMTCPIAAPLLWRAAETLLTSAERSNPVRRWLTWAREVELFCDAEMSRLQISLLSSATNAPSSDELQRASADLKTNLSELIGVGAMRTHLRTGQAQTEVASWGAAGLLYGIASCEISNREVASERYWIGRGGFFQVNRFLVPRMVELVCANRQGRLAWDLFAGVGLFARVLARSFQQVTAVEANAAAARELAAALQRLGPQHREVTAVILDFLRDAVLQRERPDLSVLDPPRAGAGVEACRLLARLAPEEIVYVSCDPVTLGRDLAVLQSVYSIERLHLVDLFPQTYHQEAVVELRRRS